MAKVIVADEVKPVLAALRAKDLPSLHRRVATLDPMLRGLDRLVLLRKGAKHREERIVLKSLSQSLADLKRAVEGMELLPEDLPTYFEIISDSLENFTSFARNQNAEEELVDLKLDDAFGRSADDALRDRRVLKMSGGREGVKHKPVHKIQRVTRNVLVHCTPFISEADIAQTGIPWVRSVGHVKRSEDGGSGLAGYTYVPNQRIIIFGNIPKGEDHESYIDAEIDRVGNYRRCPLLFVQSGVTYAWVVPSHEFEPLFSGKSIDAWCAVSTNPEAKEP